MLEKGEGSATEPLGFADLAQIQMSSCSSSEEGTCSVFSQFRRPMGVALGNTAGLVALVALTLHADQFGKGVKGG